MQYQLAKFFRSIYPIRNVRGSLAAATALCGPNRQESRDLLISNHDIYFSVSLNSYIEWNLFLFQQYEGAMISLFESLFPGNRQRTLCDIGSNIGSHCLEFAKMFRNVFAFEPNPEIFIRLQKNINLNGLSNVTAFNIALGDTSGMLYFYAPKIENINGNMGTGTFVKDFAPEFNDIITLQVAIGDEFLAQNGIENVDAIKIDAQGYEPIILSGLQQTLRDNKPLIWIEVSKDTIKTIENLGGLVSIIPYDFYLKKFVTNYRFGLIHKHLLADWPIENISEGDYVIIPVRYND